VNPDGVRATAARWLEAEPDADIQAELRDLLAGPDAELEARFAGRLAFGTAGLRAPVGAGPLRMNRLVVRQAAAGLAAYLLDNDQRAAERGVVIGLDARRKSDVFALDTARVMAARGINARLLPRPLPTPVLAWALTELDGAAAVMVTASHNPPADNGYKVYLGDGPQIVPPHDTGISARIERVDPAAVALADEHDPLIERLDESIVDRYVAFTATVRRRPATAGVAVAYTPMHGVGGELVRRAFEAAGLPAPLVVDLQFAPDPGFPTVKFPNPEERGAMDLVIALAAERGAAVALANDPDADRLGAAIPQRDGSWRRLGGDELGWLLADHILRNPLPEDGELDDRLVITTLVSSSLLEAMAADHGVHFAETFTGFKWIGRKVVDNPEWRFVFGYEQALGYLVAPRPLDKDGITAAVLMAEIAAMAAEERTTLQARLDGIATRYGRHVIADRSVMMDPAQAAARVRELLADPPEELGGAKVVDVTSYPEADLLRLTLDGGVRVQVRPSGTEPKVKLYGEAIDADPAPYLTALADLLG
jgi:phosphomannomutase